MSVGERMAPTLSMTAGVLAIIGTGYAVFPRHPGYLSLELGESAAVESTACGWNRMTRQ
jgi:hypothetical protein